MKELPINQIICGDALTELRKIPDESVDCCITSPPYWGLRDYGTAKWEGGDEKCDHLKGTLQPLKSTLHPGTGTNQNDKRTLTGMPYTETCGKCGAKRIDFQLGLEKTPEEYVAKMVGVFREVRRVMKPEATLFLNLGDSYSGSGGARYQFGDPKKPRIEHFNNPNVKVGGLKPKDLVGIPWRTAFALQADGWYLRQDIIWSKPNPMPESVKDRCTKSHEFIFLMAKSPKYYFDYQAILEPAAYDGRGDEYGPNKQAFNQVHAKDGMPARNKRSVWTITTKPFKEAHFATFPEDLIVPMVLAGTSEKGVCPDCGKAWVRIAKKEWTKQEQSPRMKAQDVKGNPMYRGGTHNDGLPHKETSKTLGWQPTCKCGKSPIPAIVLDPFIGSGTTGLVAKKLGRSYIGIDLNPKYCEMARRRIDKIGERLI